MKDDFVDDTMELYNVVEAQLAIARTLAEKALLVKRTNVCGDFHRMRAKLMQVQLEVIGLIERLDNGTADIHFNPMTGNVD